MITVAVLAPSITQARQLARELGWILKPDGYLVTPTGDGGKCVSNFQQLRGYRLKTVHVLGHVLSQDDPGYLLAHGAAIIWH